MNTFEALDRLEQARREGTRHRTFDWIRAAELIRERKPVTAGAGLQDDWEWTGGTIYNNGAPVRDAYTYLASQWAAPELELDGERIECWRYSDDVGWDENTKWPVEALKILEGT